MRNVLIAISDEMLLGRFFCAIKRYKFYHQNKEVLFDVVLLQNHMQSVSPSVREILSLHIGNIYVTLCGGII